MKNNPFIEYHPNSIDLPENVEKFIKDAKESRSYRAKSNERLLDLAERCRGLVIAWQRCHNDVRANLAKESSRMYLAAIS